MNFNIATKKIPHQEGTLEANNKDALKVTKRNEFLLSEW